MNIRVTIVFIVGSMIAVSIVSDAVAATISSTTNFKKCHCIDGNNQSEFAGLLQCEKEELQHWIFGLRMSETADGPKVELCMMLQKASSDYNWNDTSQIHENALECQEINTKNWSARVENSGFSPKNSGASTKNSSFFKEVSSIEKKVKRYHPIANITRNWEDAAKYCEEKSWKLASIESAEENSQISELLNDVESYWISGYEPIRIEGFKWKYTDKPFSYTNWAPGEPSRILNTEYDQYDSCVEIWNTKSDRLWNDHPCNALRQILCEEWIESNILR